jgi:tryptophan-rich sensory protein
MMVEAGHGSERVPPREVAAAVAAVTATAALGALPTTRAVRSDWYRNLNKPSWQPPDAAFGPVWTVLYALIATSMIVVRRDRDDRGQRPLFILYGTNLALNAAWSLIFFGGRSPLAAGVEVIALEGTTLALVVGTARVSRLAALCLVPYAIWVAFAAVLTWAISMRN